MATNDLATWTLQSFGNAVDLLTFCQVHHDPEAPSDGHFSYLGDSEPTYSEIDHVVGPFQSAAEAGRLQSAFADAAESPECGHPILYTCNTPIDMLSPWPQLLFGETVTERLSRIEAAHGRNLSVHSCETCDEIILIIASDGEKCAYAQGSNVDEAALTMLALEKYDRGETESEAEMESDTL